MRGHPLALLFALAQSDVSEGRIREHTVGAQPIARAAVAAGKIVPDDPKIVVGYVRKLRTAGTFAHGPDIGCRCLEPLIDANVAPAVQLDAALFERDPGGVGNTPRPDQDVAAPALLFAGRWADGKAAPLSRSGRPPDSFRPHPTL